ncbi:MAG: acetylornithine transaminase [Gemmatimonadaceae bacterium]|nr:acetylornithine transaminase [Gemmatimonadaceae bacterium]
MTAATLPQAGDQATIGDVIPSLLGTYKRAPMEFVRGAGFYLYDKEGKEYLDFTSGIGVNALGHGDPGVMQAMHDAMQTGLVHVSNLFRTGAGERLATALTENSFADAVFFCNSGAEANEGAFKFVRKWARKNFTAEKSEIIAVRGGFHGRLFATLAATDRPSYRAPFRPLAGGISISERKLDALKVTLDRETVAALILEPVQGEGGIRVLDPDFLRGVRELTRERDIILIFDEIQCGLGRTGKLFAYESAGVTPDVVTLAKPLAGGLPMGAVLLRADIAAAIEPGEHGTTFGGGPFVAAVAEYVFSRLNEEALLRNVRENGEWLGAQLRSLADQSEKVRAVRGTGYIWGMDVGEAAANIVRRGWDAGLLILTAGEHTLRFLPPLTAKRAELEKGLSIIKAIL